MLCLVSLLRSVCECHETASGLHTFYIKEAYRNALETRLECVASVLCTEHTSISIGHQHDRRGSL